jgi:hypothetical protein
METMLAGRPCGPGHYGSTAQRGPDPVRPVSDHRVELSRSVGGVLPPTEAVERLRTRRGVPSARSCGVLRP